MSDDKCRSTDQEITNDQSSNTPSIVYPPYLDTVKLNLELSLPAYSVIILSKLNEIIQEDDQDTGLYSVVLTSQKLYRDKFQILTQAFLDQNCYCFYVRHLVTRNHRQLQIQNRQSISMALNLCNKINKNLESFRVVLDPVSGRVYFETKSFMNESSLTCLKKHVLKQDCFYTEIIYCSIRKADKYIDLILFLLGQISLSQVTKNHEILKQFQFFKQCQQIIQRLDKNIFYVSFIDIDIQKRMQNIFINKNQKDPTFNFLKSWISLKPQQKQQQKLTSDSKQKVLKAKTQILNNSLQYFSSNTQNTIKLFTSKNLYQNIDFSVIPLSFEQDRRYLDRTTLELDMKSSVQSKKILSIIEVVQVQSSLQNQEQKGGWKQISQGGFGIIELGTVKYKNLSTSYKEPETGFSMIIKQQMIRKRDKISKKNKIQRQRKILQKLQYFNHKNIMNFYVSFQSEHENCIFSDYTPNMSLDLYLKKNEYSISFGQKISFLNQAVEGLLFLHQRKIVHLDIKPGNMLINKQLRLLLSDFGEAFVNGEDDPVSHNHAYTIPYCAPEIFYEKPQITQNVDIYAIGVCIFRVILGESFMDTFLKKKFVKRLCSKDIFSWGIGQKYEKSFLWPILKIVFLIAYKSVCEDGDRRPQLSWIVEILVQCRNFIMTLIY